MTTTVRARFDGRVLIPEEPVDLPVGDDLVLQLQTPQPREEPVTPEIIQQRLQRLESTFGLLDTPVLVPDEALRRECFYEDP